MALKVIPPDNTVDNDEVTIPLHRCIILEAKIYVEYGSHTLLCGEMNHFSSIFNFIIPLLICKISMLV